MINGRCYYGPAMKCTLTLSNIVAITSLLAANTAIKYMQPGGPLHPPFASTWGEFRLLFMDTIARHGHATIEG